MVTYCLPSKSFNIGFIPANHKLEEHTDWQLINIAIFGEVIDNLPLCICLRRKSSLPVTNKGCSFKICPAQRGWKCWGGFQNKITAFKFNRSRANGPQINNTNGEFECQDNIYLSFKIKVWHLTHTLAIIRLLIIWVASAVRTKRILRISNTDRIGVAFMHDWAE